MASSCMMYNRTTAGMVRVAKVQQLRHTLMMCIVLQVVQKEGKMVCTSISR